MKCIHRKRNLFAAIFADIIHSVRRERVRHSLKRQHLRPVYKRPYRITTDSNHKQPNAPNVLDRRFDDWQPNQAWVANMTYIGTDEGWLHLTAVIDLGSRRVACWSLYERMTKLLVCDALTMAWWQRKPSPGLIMHTGSGSQYASKRYRLLLKDYAMTASMSRKANCWDKSPMESFFKTLKVERVHRQRYVTRACARLDIVNWIEGFYNRKPLHLSIGYRTLVNAEYCLRAA